MSPSLTQTHPGLHSRKPCAAAGSWRNLPNSAIYASTFLTRWAPPAETTSPPAKRTQKATRHRYKVELLSESNADEDLQLSPVFQARQVPLPSPLPLSAPALALLLAELLISLTPPPLPPMLPPSPVQPDTPAELPVDLLTPPPSPLTSPISPIQLDTPVEPPDRGALLRAPASPPPPPPWTDTFSTDPD